MNDHLEYFKEMRKTPIPADTEIIIEGNRSGLMFILIKGCLEVRRGGIVIAQINEAGALVGEMSILLDIPHTASVWTRANCEVYVIENAETFFRSNAELSWKMARSLAQRLNAASTYLADIKKQFSGSGNHLELVDEILVSLINRAPREDIEPGSDRDPGY